MNENIRDIRQRELANSWFIGNMFGIINAAPRTGKIKISINALNQLNPHSTVLISYPDIKIKASWLKDFEKWGYENPNITFVTHMSLKKYVDKIFDVVIIDEIHLLSPAQTEICKQLFKENRVVLGLTGTLSSWTKTDLWNQLKLPVVGVYSIKQAIEEKVVTDYQITVVSTPLDSRILQTFGRKHKTEKQRFNDLTFIINKLEDEGKSSMFLRLARMRIIQNSIAKKSLTQRLLKQYSNERILVFCGVTKVADSLGIPSFHSKSTEKQIFKDFSEGIGNQLAVIRMGNTGVTYKPLSKVIVNYFSSSGEDMAQKLNRCMSYEYDNPEKKAFIYIICTDEPAEKLWLQKALEFFSPDKIKYI